jgi:alanyl-tRNA synthetase
VTHRLYYTDAYGLDFDAQVQSVSADGTRVVLDRTAFYPTSGGQPHDTGWLGPVRVIDVLDAEGADEIVHVLDAPIDLTTGAAVTGRVDGARRRDHREQHTAQHLLSAVAQDRFGWETASVHFGAERSTIEFTTPAVDEAALTELAQLADTAARAARPVSVGFEDAASALGLRKPPPRDGALRVVTIDGLDRSACGGTHVANTVELLPILLGGTESLRGRTRVAFVAGQRAIARAVGDAALLAQLGRQQSCAPAELPDVLLKLTVRVGELESERRRLRGVVAEGEARALWDATAPGPDGVRRVHLDRPDAPLEEVKPVVQALVALGGVLVCATSASPLGVLLAAAPDTGVACGTVLRAALTAAGGRGGGNAGLAQGTVPDAAALAAVVQALGFGAA